LGLGWLPVGAPVDDLGGALAQARLRAADCSEALHEAGRPAEGCATPVSPHPRRRLWRPEERQPRQRGDRRDDLHHGGNLSEWTVPTKVDLEFNFYVDPLVQAQWITDALRIAGSLPSIDAVGWIHLYDEPPESYGGLIETDGAQKPGYSAWKAG